MPKNTITLCAFCFTDMGKIIIFMFRMRTLIISYTKSILNSNGTKWL